jgi:hypothetical protein
MAPRPRVGLERIALHTDGGERIELARRRSDGPGQDALFTQRLFLVAPGGEHLVYAGHSGELRLRDAGGSERVIEGVRGRDVRFSADGRWLATLVELQRGASGELADLVLLRLDREERRSLGRVYQPRWLEWVRGGVVVRHVDQLSNRPVLTFFPLAGESRQLVARDDLDGRFTAAARGTRVLFFAGREAFTVEVSGGAPASLGELPDHAFNMEMSPDGSQAAIATSSELVRWTAAGFETLEKNVRAHSIWYSPDGSQLAYASTSEAVVLTGDGQRHELHAPGSDLRALRFRRGGDGLVVTRGDRALLWRPAAHDLSTLATSPPGRSLSGADIYRGGTVLWTRDLAAAAE